MPGRRLMTSRSGGPATPPARRGALLCEILLRVESTLLYLAEG